MASTSVTTIGELMVITQVIPRDASSISLQTPGNTEQQAPPPEVKAPPTSFKAAIKKDTFARREPQGLGVVQIFIGLLSVLFSLTPLLSPLLIHYAPFGVGLFFVVSGSLAVASGRRPSVRLARASLLTNSFSALLGLAGAIYDCFLLTAVPSVLSCGDPSQTGPQSGDEWTRRCLSYHRTLDSVLYGILGVVLVLLVLQVCVCVTVCVLAGRAIRRHKLSITAEPNGDAALLIPDGSEPYGAPTHSA
ncbi:membrane-spanning 4-domains subfamily A member 6A [Oryzias latipes]|uniref:membrane-spanning 4-domains subfamily A member 6A n=1 Tax=Oryzias latipes TaxID=8090 RepID=UPI0002A4C1CC|nr:membrane-spanning 4-domains subfamily A member 6A [Oryzias latipes]XP_020566192.1 membrane-spanning 4-domains subfamily A member 6A [Oryzias latipes]